jgi:hypothetical protein
MKKQEKDRSEQAVLAQAVSNALAGELGVSDKELIVIRAFVDVVNARVKSAAVEPFSSSAETHVRKRFPNNEDALAQVDVTLIETLAQKWVEDACLGRAIAGLEYPAPIQRAKESVASVARRLTASPGDEAVELSYAKAIKWLAQMQCQGVYKAALAPLFQAVYRVQTGSMYKAPDKTELATTPDDSLNTLMSDGNNHKLVVYL